MINLLIGRPGSGKSYEAVVHHIMPALESGRMVVTNLPLNLDIIAAIEHSYLSLIRSVGSSRIEGKLVPAFGSLKHFDCEWRDDKNRGPLYVIDECHKPFPKGKTPLEIDEWFAEHRHLGVDVLLITQSYRKISAAIVDMVQVSYRVSNNRTLGSDKSYVRKVQDGVRGEVINTSIRTYNTAKFSLYTSHTKTDGSVKEAMVSDVVPLWRHWSFIGAAACAVLAIFLISTNDMNILQPKLPSQAEKESHAIDLGDGVMFEPAPIPSANGEALPAPGYYSEEYPAELREKPKPKHPYHKVQLHIAGYLESEKGFMYGIRATQNGQAVFDMAHNDLILAGYQIENLGPCSLHLSYDEYSEYLTCDVARQGTNLPQVGNAEFNRG